MAAREHGTDEVWRTSSYSANAGGNCVEVGWKVSSYSPDTGGNCVEVGWRISTYSTQAGGNCVEAGPVRDDSRVAVRDTKDRDGGMLITSSRGWLAFARAAGAGELV